MRKKTILLLFILIAALIGAYLYYNSGKKEQAVTIVTVKSQNGYIAKKVTATGTIQPLDTVSVGAQVSGVIKSVFVDFNSIVKKGQLLAKVDPSIIIAQTEQSKANLANVKSNLEYQQSNFDRQNQLFNLGAISKADYQIALNQFNSAKASVANATAQLNLAEKNLFYTDIYSPINGVVLNRNVSAGQTIASSFNAPTLFVIAKDLTKMQVRAAVDEADIGGVQQGQRVTFTVDAFPDDIFEGVVEQILLHASVSANVVTYTTLVNVENKDMKLKPGMTASITIYIEEDTNALLVPSRALNFKPDSTLLKAYKIIRAERRPKNATGNDSERKNPKSDSAMIHSENPETRRSFVWVKTGDTLTEKKITISLNDDTYAKVVKGLSPDEEVVINILIGDTKNAADAKQRSPFMPQMGRRPAASPRN